MILARVQTRLGNQAIVAELTDEGWLVPDAPALGRILNMDAAPENFGPADGDPWVRAANRAAEVLDGTVLFVREPDPAPPDAVF